MTASSAPPNGAVDGYPRARRLDLVDDLHGRPVPDPYRWLERGDSPETESWHREQDELTRRRLDGLPGREALDARLTELTSAGSVSVPTWRAGRAFLTRRVPGQDHVVLHVRERADDGSWRERPLIDVAEIDPSGRTTLDTWSPSLEGDLLAYQLSVGGDEHSVLFVVDVRTGERVDGPIDRCRYSAVAWLPGGKEFYYVRRLPPERVPAGEEQFHRRVLRHVVGQDSSEDEVVLGEGLDPTNYYGVRVCPRGRWLLVTARPGTAPRDSVWIADLQAGGTLTQLVDQRDGIRVDPWVDRTGVLVVRTTDGAPRWRLCVADPERPERAEWRELVPEEPDAVLEGARYLPGGPEHPSSLVVLRSRHARSELSLHHPTTGEPLGDVPLPGPGAVTGLSTVDDQTGHDEDRIWIGWTDFVTPPGVLEHSVLTGPAGLVSPAPGAVRPPEVRTDQISYHSADGQLVRMFVVSPAGVPDRPRPTLLTGYGGFSVSRRPGYSSAALAWVAAGGVWVVASLRGGGEEGEDWHRAGMRQHKQRVFDDFHAAAEHLVAQGWTTPEQLAIMGGSNGGLLVGAALTQRPELYRAVVCSAPLLDMVRYEHFLLGRTWNDEYGSAEVPEELDWLLAYSPYHHVVSGARYPSVLFTVFDSDTRVDPCHARKMCAALQHATSGEPAERPVLLRRETEVGHGARSVSRSVALSVDQLAFLAEATGLDLG
ncbi:S9 family peptidase [Actinoalloteichus sp. AHMU CJ021]|uniref:prolyl oligopeptidase family serine peptidase n=1 Tax=Actinoalloteichus TaxID=65496 RepID=UPI000CA0389A|nr:S9 family peptidase [Actinoalloteichus sp. AHMU CJ021]